jgi:hypothetical protein
MNATQRQPFGPPASGADRQRAVVMLLGENVDTAGNGGAVDVSGINGALTLEVYKTGTGTCNIHVQHTMDPWNIANDNSPWEDMRIAALGSAGALTVVVGAQSIAATNPLTQGFAILDAYPTLRVNVESVSGTVLVQARLYMAPQ